MADYSQTPPEGLWEAIDGKIRKPAAPVFPWWWALAGAAAAVAAVLLLWPGSLELGSPRLAEVEAVADTLGVGTEDAQGDSLGAAQGDSLGVAVPVDKLAPVEHVAPSAAKTLTAARQNAAPEAAGKRESAPVEAEAAPVETEDVPVETEKAPVETEKAPERPLVAEAKDDSGNPAQKEPAQKEPAQEEPAPKQLPETPERHYPADQPRLAQVSKARTASVSFVGAGVPGGPASSTFTEYAMSAASRADGSRAASPMAALLSRNRTTTTIANHKMTFRAGFMVNVPLSRHFSMESGLLYTILSADITSVSGGIEALNKQRIHYLGIPLHAVYTPLSTRHFSCYISAGPMVEFSFRTDWKTAGSIDGVGTGSASGRLGKNDWLWSLEANAGVQWHPYSKGAFFLQPGISWHFPKEGAQESFYTVHPLAFTLSAGYRIFF